MVISNSYHLTVFEPRDMNGQSGFGEEDVVATCGTSFPELIRGCLIGETIMWRDRVCADSRKMWLQVSCTASRAR